MRKFPDTPISADPALYILLPLCLLLFPLKFVFSWLLAALIHEMGHYAAVRACGYRIVDMRIGLVGAVIHTEPMPDGTALLCAAAGPLIGGLLICLSRWMPVLAICSLIQTTYNLFPLPGNDGENIMVCCLRLFIPKQAAAVSIAIRWLLIILVNGLLLHLTFSLKLGNTPLILAGILTLKAACGKIPCKAAKQIVQ